MKDEKKRNSRAKLGRRIRFNYLKGALKIFFIILKIEFIFVSCGAWATQLGEFLHSNLIFLCNNTSINYFTKRIKVSNFQLKTFSKRFRLAFWVSYFKIVVINWVEFFTSKTYFASKSPSLPIIFNDVRTTHWGKLIENER